MILLTVDTFMFFVYFCISAGIVIFALGVYLGMIIRKELREQERTIAQQQAQSDTIQKIIDNK